MTAYILQVYKLSMFFIMGNPKIIIKVHSMGQSMADSIKQELYALTTKTQARGRKQGLEMHDDAENLH